MGTRLPPLGPGSGGPMLTPPHVFPLQPRSRFTLIFLFRSHSSLCSAMLASTFCCSSLVLWPMFCTTPLFIRGTFKPGHRKPERPGDLNTLTNKSLKIHFSSIKMPRRDEQLTQAGKAQRDCSQCVTLCHQNCKCMRAKSLYHTT